MAELKHLYACQFDGPISGFSKTCTCMKMIFDWLGENSFYTAINHDLRSSWSIFHGLNLPSASRFPVYLSSKPRVMTDKNIEIARLQGEIENYIGLGPGSMVFDFEEVDRQIELRVITVNPRHRQSFLFHITEGRDKVEALEKMVDYVKNYKEKESSYTIQWRIRGEDHLNTSYFSAKNVIGALDKLFYGRDPNSITVFSVILNPMS